MGEKEGTFQFVPVGQGGQPTNAHDRKTVRKAAMLAFRRQERIERVKAFAAECAAEAEPKTAASPAPIPFRTSNPTKAQEPSASGTVALATKSHPRTVLSILKQEPSADSNIPFIPQIPRNLGYFTDLSSMETPDTAYVLDYCTLHGSLP